jgi:geranylgeranylglycerol-phosphate geranylgeranyltransferase
MAMRSRLAATIQIARPHNMLAAAGCVAAGYALSGGTDAVEVLLPCAFTAVVTGFGNLINDYHDRDIDRINKPERPLPSGRLTPPYVMTLYVAGTVATTLAMAFLLPARLLALILGWEALLYYYARWGKRVTFLGNLTVAGIAGSAFLGGGLVSGNVLGAAFPGILAFLLVMGRELIKGAEDVIGDRPAGALTVAVRYGPERAGRLAALVLCLCVILSPIPAVTGYYGRVYGLVMELLFVPGLLAASWLALSSWERQTLHRASRILKVQMFFGIAAMALGRV